MLSHRDPHVDDGTLLAHLDGELPAEARERVGRHVADCAMCGARRDELRFAVRRVTSALEVIDGPPARTEMPAALREAARSAPVSIGSARQARLGARVGWMGRRSVAVAAGLTFLLAAGAYAVPGSPVRGWVDDRIDAIASWFTDETQEPEQAGPSRVSVEPDDGVLRITIVSGGEAVRLTVRLTDEAEASVAAADADFHVEPGTIDIADASGEIVVTLPRGAASGSVMIDEAEVVRLEDGELRRTASADAGLAQIFLDTDG